MTEPHPTLSDEELDEMERGARSLWSERQEDCAKYGADIPMPKMGVAVDQLACLITSYLTLRSQAAPRQTVGRGELAVAILRVASSSLRQTSSAARKDLAFEVADEILTLLQGRGVSQTSNGIPSAGQGPLSDAQRADIEAHIRGLTETKDTYNMPPGGGWRCFHCGERFKTEEGARLHFGTVPAAIPLCAATALRAAINEHVKTRWQRGFGSMSGYVLDEASVDAAVRAALTPPGAGEGWRTMDSAPMKPRAPGDRAGPLVFLLIPYNKEMFSYDERWDVGFWSIDAKCWRFTGDDGPDDIAPVAWAPINPPAVPPEGDVK